MRAWGAVPKWLREQSAKLRCSGSTPLGASTTALRAWFVWLIWSIWLFSSLNFLFTE